LNLDGTRNVGSLVLELGVQRFVFVSTTDVYGIRDFHGESEDQLPLGMTVRNPYPEFKILAEEWIRDTLPPHRYTILRPGAVWGPGDTTLTPRMLDFLRASPALVHFGPWKGANRWPLAHVRNVATAAYLAATRPEAAGKAINVLDPEHTSLDRFYRLLAQAFLPGKRLRRVHLPTWMGKGMGWGISLLSDRLNLDQPFADPSFYAAHHVSSNLDLSTARLEALFRAGGRDFVTLEDGMERLRTIALEEGVS
jgi:nucleoside-diphosphate-sugar epimerase